jgi:hypothetical protein
MSPVVARVDERLRLAGCLLAASDWPEREQSLKPYRPHRVAEGARRALSTQRPHAAVEAARGFEPARLLAHALAGDWPGGMATAVSDFASTLEVQHFCAESQAEWQAARADLETVLARGDLAGFLAGLFDGVDQVLVVHPNLLYPGQQALAVRAGDQIVLSLPPPAAWGASPPWRYNERPDEVLGAVAEGLARPLFEQAQTDEPNTLALAAAVLFLRQVEGADAADQFMLMEQRARKLPQLPTLVEKLARRKTLNREERED